VSYYYLVASLPTLERGDPAPMTPEEFLFHCTGALSRDDWDELERVVAGRNDECVTPSACRWFAVDAQMRNAAARARAGRLGVDAGEFLRPHQGWDDRAEKAVADAFAKPTPLEREVALDECRWAILDEMAADDPYGLGPVVAYAVKLLITARWHEMNDERGQARLEQIIETNTGDEAWDEFFTMDEESERALK
jgi:hypothetical protein